MLFLSLYIQSTSSPNDELNVQSEWVPVHAVYRYSHTRPGISINEAMSLCFKKEYKMADI